MNKRERVLAALNAEPVDYVPSGFWFHFAGEEARGEANIQAHLNYYSQEDLDFVKVMCDGYFAYPAPVEVVTEHRWDLVKPLSADHPFISEQVERAKRIIEGTHGECCVFYNVFCPLSSLRFTFEEAGSSFDDLTDALKQDPLPVMAALDAIAQTNALLCERLIQEAGVDGVYYCVQGGEATRFTLEQHRKLVRPSDLYVLEHANRYSDNNILHMCGWAGAPNQLEVWRDYPAKAVNWAVFVEGLTLFEGRRFFGGRTVMGGFETHWDGHVRQGVIYSGTQEEIRAYTRSLILDYGRRGLILGGDCTVDAAIDRDHLRWVQQAAQEL